MCKTFKPLKKEVEEDIRGQKDPPCSWIGKINVKITIEVKMTILTKQSVD